MKALLVSIGFLTIILVPGRLLAQKGSSIVIHDNTTAANGGENATSQLRKEIASALSRDKPCTDLMDDKDIRDVLQSEREKNLLEGGDPQQVLTDIANLMGASYVMSVSATPGPGSNTTYTVFVMDPKTGTTIARQTGTDASQVADNISRQLGPNLSDDCKPHWVGQIRYTYSFNESKTTNDAGAMHAGTRNTKRSSTESFIAQSTIVAMLLPPKSGSNVTAGKTIARVWMRMNTVAEKKQETTGEIYCRAKGENPRWKGYSLTYTETTTQTGGGSDNLPVYISIDGEGNFKIVVNTPAGTLLGKFETSRSETGCSQDNPPSKDAVSMPEQKTEASGFDVTGKAGSNNPDKLSGSKTMPDGKTTIHWELKLVKPKDKKKGGS